jgi:hypothetical protein
MPPHQGLDSTFYFHNNEFGLAKVVLLAFELSFRLIFMKTIKKKQKNIQSLTRKSHKKIPPLYPSITSAILLLVSN